MDRIGHRISFDFPGLRLDFWLFQTNVTLFVGESTAAKIFTKALVGICGYRLRAYSCASILQPGQVRNHTVFPSMILWDPPWTIWVHYFCWDFPTSHGSSGGEKTWIPGATHPKRNAERCAICDAKFSSSFAEHLCSRRHFSALFHAVSTMAPMLGQGVKRFRALHQIRRFPEMGGTPQSSCIFLWDFHGFPIFSTIQLFGYWKLPSAGWEIPRVFSDTLTT